MKYILLMLLILALLADIGGARTIAVSSCLTKVEYPDHPGHWFYASVVRRVPCWPQVHAPYIWAYDYHRVVPLKWFGPYHFRQYFCTFKTCLDVRYLLHITADNSYIVYLNGHFVGADLGIGVQQLQRDGQQEGQGDHLWATVETYDITPLIRHRCARNRLDVWAVNWYSYLDWTGHQSITGVAKYNPAMVTWRVEEVPIL